MSTTAAASTTPAAAPCILDGFGSQEYSALARLARGLCRSRAGAEDLLQEALERALRTSDRFAAGSNLTAWMHTVMYRLAIDETRRTRPGWEGELDELAAASSDDEEPAPWAALGAGDLRAAVAMLPETLRRPYVLAAFEQRSYVEIAGILGIPARTVGTRLHRARLKLRGLLEQNRVVAFPTADRPRMTPGRRHAQRRPLAAPDARREAAA